jgi:hypothetical protein
MGVGLLFVPGGQAIGAGILIGVAISSGAGIATGTFDPRMAAFNGVIGGITGGVGSALSGAGVATQVAVGAGLGGGGNALTQQVFTGHVDWSQVAISTAVGGVGAGVGAKIAAARSANAGGVESLPPSSVRFSQTSVNDAQEIADSMRTRGWVGDPIDVVRMPDGRLTTVDNTRVLAAHQAGIDVRASVHGFDEALPGKLVPRFTTPKGGEPTTWGDAVTKRIGKQNALYRTTYPMGSPVIGWNGS